MTTTAARRDEVREIDGVLAALRTVVDDAASAGDRIGLDVVLGRLDEEIFGFKLQRARAEAWEAAVLLVGQAPEAREQTVRMLDRYAHGVGRFVLAPPFPVPAALQVVRFAERVETSEAIRRLDGALGI